MRAAERRFEPTRPDEVRQLAANFLAGTGLNERVDRVAAASRRKPGKRECPCLCVARSRSLRRIDQRLDVGRIEPQRGQRLERLAGRDRLREEDAVDAAGAGAGDDVDQNAETQTRLAFDFLQQRLVGAPGRRIRQAFDPIVKRRNIVAGPVECLARHGQSPHLLGDAVHIDGKADAAVTDESETKLLLPHRPIGSGARHEPSAGSVPISTVAQIGR